MTGTEAGLANSMGPAGFINLLKYSGCQIEQTLQRSLTPSHAKGKQTYNLSDGTSQKLRLVSLCTSALESPTSFSILSSSLLSL